jgi:flagellar hook-basal body complex protein FliE
MATPSIAAGAYAAAARKLGSGGGAGINPGSDGGDSFANLLSQAVGSVQESGKAADVTALNTAVGRTDLIDVVTAVAESETAIQTLVSVRDRVIAAYEEIMRMPI